MAVAFLVAYAKAGQPQCITQRIGSTRYDSYSRNFITLYAAIFPHSYHNSVNLSQLCSRKPSLAGGPAKFDRMSKQPPQPHASGMPDLSSRARTERPTGRLPQRPCFTLWGKQWQQCFTTTTPPSDFCKGAGFSRFGSEPAPFAFYPYAASFSCPFSAHAFSLAPYPAS
jgi:hypothetical protein